MRFKSFFKGIGEPRIRKKKCPRPMHERFLLNTFAYCHAERFWKPKWETLLGGGVMVKYEVQNMRRTKLCLIKSRKICACHWAFVYKNSKW